MQVLITAGAAVDAREENNTTALHLAAQNGHAGAIQLLITAEQQR
jgi:ankyrin repeat protein